MLLFDAMLSPKLVGLLSEEFLGSLHVRSLGFQNAADPVIWEHARANRLTIVTKDSDYEDLSLRLGWPPKVICIVSGNGPSEPVRQVLSANRESVLAFISDVDRGVFFLG